MKPEDERMWNGLLGILFFAGLIGLAAFMWWLRW